MTETSALRRKLHALLIGVDCYLPNRLPGGGSYPSLGGCVRDVNHVESFLKERLGIVDEQIIKLTASHGETREPAEPKHLWPTYENIVAAFQKIIERAEPGEQVYIHYSGHGGRSLTAFPELKGAQGLDESLVPTDIGNSEARYLRDVEMAHLLKQMSNKNLVATIVFDSCHSGGATRGFGGGAVRGIPVIDTTERLTESLVAPREDLSATWRAIPVAQTRSAQFGGGWVPEMPDTLLLAACRANELANEYAFEGEERNGALTYWLLDSLKQIGPGLTFKMVHDRILAKVHAKFPQQTPQLHGDGARVVFDTARVPRPPSVRVLRVDFSHRRLKLNAGEAQGIPVGARFAVYPAQSIDFTEPTESTAVVEVSEVEASEAWAKIVESGDAARLEEGAQAVLLDAGSIRLRGRIRLVEQDDLPEGIDQSAALERLAREIRRSGWIREADEGKEADYQVAVNANGEYEVWDPSGQLISNLRPALMIADADAAAQMRQRLVHLTKYRNVKLIDNSATHSRLARGLAVELTGVAVDAPGGVPVLNVGESAVLRITNSSNQVLNITIFDLQPEWGIAQVYPSDTDSEILEPGRPLELPFSNLTLPEGYTDAVETVKVFATVEPTSFRWLELPALDKPVSQQRADRGVPQGALEELMSAFTADAPPTGMRSFNLAAAPVTNWTTAQLDFRVRRPPQALKHVRDKSISLLQAAFEEVAATNVERTRARGEGDEGAHTTRPGISDPAVVAITEYLAAPDEAPPASDAASRGYWEQAKYCAGLASGMAGEFFNAFVKGDREKYDSYKDALTAKFGDCDPNFKDALTKYAEFLWKSGHVPYLRWQKLSDFVADDKLPRDATIGLVADWGTGQPEALEVLRQVRLRNPQVMIHLGDIYYAGTEHEVENYFYRPWMNILEPDASGIASFALPGNHDLYSGGQPFYDLLRKLGQPASYFCLRNQHWQIIGLDTALHDRIFGESTTLEPSEVEWLRDKVENAGGRRTIILSHHQLFSAYEQFGGESVNQRLHAQVADLLPHVDLWMWGHEHDLVVFEEFAGLKRGRCIGGSAFPVGKYEVPETVKNPDVPFNRKVMLSKGKSFYQHCYATIELDDAKASISYFEDSAGGRVLFTETI